jgi:hypothetical protein
LVFCDNQLNEMIVHHFVFKRFDRGDRSPHNDQTIHIPML